MPNSAAILVTRLIARGAGDFSNEFVNHGVDVVRLEPIPEGRIVSFYFLPDVPIEGSIGRDVSHSTGLAAGLLELL